VFAKKSPKHEYLCLLSPARHAFPDDACPASFVPEKPRQDPKNRVKIGKISPKNQPKAMVVENKNRKFEIFFIPFPAST
jgi:hypothetical protein